MSTVLGSDQVNPLNWNVISEQTMREHRDIIKKLSIILDDDIRQFELYATRLENKVKAQTGPKLAFTEQRYRAYDVDGVTLILRADPSFLGVSIHTANDSHDDLLRSVAEKISND